MAIQLDEKVDDKVAARIEHASDTPSIKSNGDVLKPEEDTKEANQIAANWREGTEEERKLVRKLDWRILPCTWVLYLLGYLDRANIG